MTEKAVLHAMVEGGPDEVDFTLRVVRRLSVEESEQNLADVAI